MKIKTNKPTYEVESALDSYSNKYRSEDFQVDVLAEDGNTIIVLTNDEDKEEVMNAMSDNNIFATVIKENTHIKPFDKFLNEDTSSTGGPSIGGMGQVVSAQPSGLAGATIGTNWASGGGTTGSGDVSVPYNPSGYNRMFQQLPAEMGKNHGARTGKKSRKKRLDMKSLKDIFSKRADFTAGQGESKPGGKKIMDFNDFAKADINTVKKESLNEGAHDVKLTTGKFGNIIIAFQKDIENNSLSLMDGYFSGSALIGSETSVKKSSVDFSSPFYKGQSMHDKDDDKDVEELDFKYHETMSKSVVEKFLNEYVSKNYNGKITKIYYH